ncbi:MAG: 30S ribosomal protein S2 [Patescibacteria group bacterium]
METVAMEHMASSAVDPEIEAMMEAGVHIGHIRSKRHPAMAPYLWGVRSNVEIIDITKTKEKLGAALDFLRQSAQGKKLFLFVGTRPSARELVARSAEALGMPYVNQRWIGGTLTNFKVIGKQIETLEKLESEIASGGFEKYTKKERMKKEADLERLRHNFDGLRRMKKLPDIVVIIDIAHDDLALREARRMNIPVVALVDTDTDPRLVTYPIPSNDNARPAIAYMLDRVEKAIADGQAALLSPESGGGEGAVTGAIANTAKDDKHLSNA